MQIAQCHRSELVQACLKWPRGWWLQDVFWGVGGAASKQGCSRNGILCWWQAVGKIGTRLKRPNHRIWTQDFLAGSRVWNLQNFLCWLCSCLCDCTAALSDRSCERVEQFRCDVSPAFYFIYLFFTKYYNADKMAILEGDIDFFSPILFCDRASVVAFLYA